MSSATLLNLPLELLLTIVESLDIPSLASLLASSSTLTKTLIECFPSLITRRPALLHAAARNNHIHLLSSLLRLIPATTKNVRRETPLVAAASGGSIAAVKMLAPLDPSSVSAALIAASSTGQTGTVVHLLDTCYSHSSSTLTKALCAAAGSGDQNTVGMLLLVDGVEPHCCDEYGQTPLQCAAKKGKTEVVRALLSLGKVKRWIDSQDIHGWSALRWAVLGDYFETALLLKQEGATLDEYATEYFSTDLGAPMVDVSA
ncbi:ankyrin repeat-containing domain protein [Pyronema omphalodes]|nr:ankyrin repeat-containing domain protein [Pyronema omphalodes]